jgi:hypothetical protein
MDVVPLHPTNKHQQNENKAIHLVRLNFSRKKGTRIELANRRGFHPMDNNAPDEEAERGGGVSPSYS